MINNTTVSNALYGRSVSSPSSDPFVTLFSALDPTPYDVAFPIQKTWLNTTTNTYWFLKNFTTTGGVTTANWIQLGGPMHFISTLTGNTGGPVGPAPVTNNVNLLGDGISIETTGNPSLYTMTISTGGTVPVSFVEQVGTATPAGGVLNVIGTQGMSSHGFGNTVEMRGTPSVAAGSSSIANLGTASFNSNHFSVDANGYVSADNEVATNYAGNVGFAVPVGSVLNVFGSGNITTSASGNTITISEVSPSISTINTQVFTTSGTYTPTSGMKFCKIECLGAGGAGGGSPADAGGPTLGGGGGAGEYASGLFNAAAIGVSQTVTIGAKGVGSLGASGSAGGATSVGVLISANGGSGGTASGVSKYLILGAFGGSGGSGGSVRTRGQNGGYSFSASGGPIIVTGAGGSCIYGSGGASVGSDATPSSSDGINGFGFGSGGSGGFVFSDVAVSTGGDGADGIVIITEYIA